MKSLSIIHVGSNVNDVTMTYSILHKFHFALDNMPNALWIWDVQKLTQVATLLQVGNIRGKIKFLIPTLEGGGGVTSIILLPQIQYSVIEGHFAQDCACAEWILLWRVRQTYSGFYWHYVHRRPPKFLILLKKAQVSWMCFIISNDFKWFQMIHNFKYTAHHNLLGICHQLQIRHLYGTFNFLTHTVYLYGDRKLVCLQFSLFSWKGAPSTKEKCICGSVNCKLCHICEKKKMQKMCMFFRLHGMRISLKGCQNHEKWKQECLHVNHYDQSYSHVIKCEKGR